MLLRHVFWIVLLFPALHAGGGAARTLSDCDLAAENAARHSGVPKDILLAIARVESGRSVQGRFLAWPWTVNQAGRGSFFDTAEQAIAHVDAALAEGQRNIDIGCFQINIHWHGKAFPSLEAMFDPERNALYAANFLSELMRETGSWEAAIGTYHSRGAAAAEAYLAKVARQIGEKATMTAAPSPARPDDLEQPRAVLVQAPQPLLVAGGGLLGSLVAQDARGATAPLLR